MDIRKQAVHEYLTYGFTYHQLHKASTLCVTLNRHSVSQFTYQQIMVDTERRKKLAFHLRHLSVGLITNDDFENNLMDDVTNGWLPEQYYRSKEAKFDDQIIQPMLELCWGLYDDTRQHKLKGSDKLSDQSLKVIARCILFLQTDREYEWPYFDTNSPLFKFSLGEIILSILTFGQYYRVKRKEKEEAFLEFQKLGNFDIWPFLKTEDYETQLKMQPFLKGQKSILN